MMRWRGPRGLVAAAPVDKQASRSTRSGLSLGTKLRCTTRAASGLALHRHALRDRCTEHEEAGLAQCARSDNRVAAGSAFAFHAKHQRGDRAVLVGAEWFDLALAMPSRAEPPR